LKHTIATPKLDRIDLSHDGIAMFLGPTSTEVMQVLWDAPGTIKSVWTKLRRTKLFEDTMYTTIATTCNRLVDRGFLTRNNIASDGKPTFHFVPTMTEVELTQFCIYFIIHRIQTSFNITNADLIIILE